MEADEKDFLGNFNPVHEIPYLTSNQVTPSLSFVIDWSREEQSRYAKWAKDKWLTWWDREGQFIAMNRLRNSKSFPDAWREANRLTRIKNKQDHVPKIWIPDEWTMLLTFKTGDYVGMEKERWILHSSTDEHRLYRIHANVWGLRPIGLERCMNITKEELDHYLKIVTYIIEYQLRNPKPERKEENSGYYYPNGTIRLDAKEKSIWYLKGYDHHSEPHQYAFSDSGYTLNGQKAGLARSVAKALWDNKQWKTVTQLGEVGRALVRETLRDRVFERIEGDSYRFVVLAPSGDEEDALLIEQAIQWAEKIYQDRESNLDLVTKDRFTSAASKWSLITGVKDWREILKHIRQKNDKRSPVLNDILLSNETPEAQFKLLSFDGDPNDGGPLRIPIGIMNSPSSSKE